MGRDERWSGDRFGRTAPDAADGSSADERDGRSIRLTFLDPAQDARRRVLVFLLGVSPGDLERRLDVALRGIDPRRDIPVFVVTTLEFAALRDRGALFEYIPTAADLGPSQPEAFAAYARRRLAIVRLKWEAGAEIDLGQPFEEFLSDNLAAAARAR